MTAFITNFVLDSRSKRRVEFLKWKVKNTFRVLMFYYYYFFLNAIKHYSRAYLARLKKKQQCPSSVHYFDNSSHKTKGSGAIDSFLRQDDGWRRVRQPLRSPHNLHRKHNSMNGLTVSRRGDRAHVMVFSAQESHDVSRSHPVLNLHFENELVVGLIHQTEVMYQRLNHCLPRVPQSFSSVVVDVVDGQQVIECAIINLEKIEWWKSAVPFALSFVRNKMQGIQRRQTSIKYLSPANRTKQIHEQISS